MSSEYLSHPIDTRSADRLAERGLRLELLDRDSETASTAWHNAVHRGFLGPRPTPEAIAQSDAYTRDRRATGVWDDTAADPITPVATVDSWPAELTVPGRRSVPAWAISAVTVSPTHRRSGIATAMLEAELRTAAALGLPLAMLTVSEATIYARFGFAPSAWASDLVVKTDRAGWAAERAPGRLHFVEKEAIVDDGLTIVERVRLATPGQIQYSGYLWERTIGYLVADETAKARRIVRYDDENGVPQGFAVYRLIEREPDFAGSDLELSSLVAATSDAYSALWRFVLEHDLVSTVSARLRPVGEPLPWLIADRRAVAETVRDHLWTRVLDVPAAFEGRGYSASGRIVLEVSDPLGYARGRWSLSVDEDLEASVTATTDAADVALTATDLAALYLGGTSPAVLAHTGTVVERRAGALVELEAITRSPVTPWLSIWF